MLGRQLPSYDLFLIVIGPLVLLVLHFALARTRFGRLVRAATQDREMVGALGVNQAVCLRRVRARRGARRPRRRAAGCARARQLATDLIAIGDAFVVVVVGGMGSITGAYLAAVIDRRSQSDLHRHRRGRFWLLHGELFEFTLVAEFLVMAVVLIVRPYGLLAGRRRRCARLPSRRIRSGLRRRALKMLGAAWLCCWCACRCLAQASPYLLVLGIDVLIAVIFATSLHFIMGPGGMHSFGHAAYFGLGAYGAALLVKWLGAPMGLALIAAPVVALAGALLFGWFAVVFPASISQC